MANGNHDSSADGDRHGEGEGNGEGSGNAPSGNGHRRQPRKIDLALQGGGSHGAFTWGVLDALLEDERFDFDGISGCSAGALNAAVLICGFAAGGRAGARRALTAFWHDVGAQRHLFALPGAGGFGGLGDFNLDGNPWFAIGNAWAQLFSPYQFNPANFNPLRAVLRRHIDAAVLRRSPLKLFVTATSVRTGQPEVFAGERLSVDALLASSCLPQVFQAVEIDGEPYWDGGYVANPALWPLYETETLDIVLVTLDPLLRASTPKTTLEIADRVNEIGFNATLCAELRAIRFVKRLLADGRVDPGQYRDLRLHRIADDEALEPLGLSSKYNTDPTLLNQLFVLGRAAALRWLQDDSPKVGREPSFDIDAVFLARRHAH